MRPVVILLAVLLQGCVAGPDDPGSETDEGNGAIPAPSIHAHCDRTLPSSDIASPGGPAELTGNVNLWGDELADATVVVTVYLSDDYSAPLARSIWEGGTSTFKLTGLPADTVDLVIMADSAYTVKEDLIRLTEGRNSAPESVYELVGLKDEVHPGVILHSLAEAWFKPTTPRDTLEAIADRHHLTIKEIKTGKDNTVSWTRMNLQDDQQSCRVVDTLALHPSVSSAHPVTLSTVD